MHNNCVVIHASGDLSDEARGAQENRAAGFDPLRLASALTLAAGCDETQATAAHEPPKAWNSLEQTVETMRSRGSGKRYTKWVSADSSKYPW